VYDVLVLAGRRVVGANTVEIRSISGSSGATFLGPNFVSFPAAAVWGGGGWG